VTFSPLKEQDEYINILVEEPKEYENNTDIDEDTIKNIVSTKGKFASYLQNRNIRKINLKKFLLRKMPRWTHRFTKQLKFFINQENVTQMRKSV
jgi:hypothetical protein